MSPVRPLSDDTKAKLRDLGHDPDQVIIQEIRCKKMVGKGRACRRHIGTVYLERIGRILRIDGGPRGYVTPNLEREPALPGQRWFDFHCEKHEEYVDTLPGDVETVFS